MKTILAILLIAITLGLSSCAQDANFNGVHYETYGLFNEEDCKSDSVYYEISASSVIWSILCAETIIVPVYNVGWNLWQPVKLKETK